MTKEMPKELEKLRNKLAYVHKKEFLKHVMQDEVFQWGFDACFNAMVNSTPPTHPLYIQTSLVNANYVEMKDVKVLIEALDKYKQIVWRETMEGPLWIARDTLESFYKLHPNTVRDEEI